MEVKSVLKGTGELKSGLDLSNDIKRYNNILNNKISAIEIQRQRTRVLEEIENFIRSSNTIIKRLGSLSRTVMSEDSNLAKQINLYQEAYIRIQGSIETSFGNLAGVMHTYATQALQNEEQTQQEVTTLENSLNDLIGEISSISFD